MYLFRYVNKIIVRLLIVEIPTILFFFSFSLVRLFPSSSSSSCYISNEMNDCNIKQRKCIILYRAMVKSNFKNEKTAPV